MNHIEPVAWAIEVTVHPEGGEPYDALDDVYLDPSGAQRMAQNYTAKAESRLVPLYTAEQIREMVERAVLAYPGEVGGWTLNAILTQLDPNE